MPQEHPLHSTAVGVPDAHGGIPCSSHGHGAMQERAANAFAVPKQVDLERVYPFKENLIDIAYIYNKLSFINPYIYHNFISMIYIFYHIHISTLMYTYIEHSWCSCR